MTQNWFWLFLLLFLNDEKNNAQISIRYYREDSGVSALEKKEKYN